MYYSPIISISNSIFFLNLSYTSLVICSTNSNTSFALAFPVFMIKPACISDTFAPPILYPFNPHSSINLAVI